MNYPHLAQRLYNSALLITPGKAEVIEQVFRAYCEGRGEPGGQAPERKELAAPGLTRADGGYYRTRTGIALIPIIGTLVQRADSMDAASGLIGYNRIASQLAAALDDPMVDAILLEIDSNGGEAAGVMDLAGKIAAANKRKPTWTTANEAAFSAAYWLAAASGRISAPESGMVGSIGVVMMHVDQSVKDAKAGVTYTPIFAGDRKVDFSAHAPLSDAALQVAQDEVDRVYDLFVAGVVAGRPGLTDDAVRATQAGLFHAKAAVDIGLIDAVESFDATLAALAAEAQHVRMYGPRHRAQSTQGVETMDPKDKPAAGAASPNPDQIAATQAAAVAEAEAVALRRGAEIERARIAGILSHAEAADRRALAEHLAFRTANSVEDAAALLAAAPKNVPAAPANLLAAAMDKLGNPKVGADAEAGDGSPQKQTILTSGQVFAMRRKQAGH